MAQQIINVGSAPNDGTGDLLRNSQIKANANFTELYNIVDGYLSSDETSYTDATLPLSATDELLVNQGGTWKKVDKSEIASDKLDKVTTAGVERVYTINADGSQGTKPTSDFKDVLEFANFASFPTTGESGKIYVAIDTNKTYRWSGTTYVEISPSEVNSVNGKTGVVIINKTDVGLSNVDNTSDLDKPISTSTQVALDNKVDKNPTIVGSTKTKITYDAKGLVTDGSDATTADINDSIDRRYVTDTQLDTIQNTSGINTGDETTLSIQTKRPLKTINGESLEGVGNLDIGASTAKACRFELTNNIDLGVSPTGSVTVIDFDNSVFNTNSSVFVNNGSGTVTCTQAGSYLVITSIVLESPLVSAITKSELGIRKNGTAVICATTDDTTIALGQNVRSLTTSTIINLNANDTLQTVVNLFGINANGRGLRLPALFGTTATQVSNISIEKLEVGGLESTEKLVTNATVTGTYNVDWTNDVWDLTLTGNTTLSESNLPATGKTKTITLNIVGNFTLTYPSGWTSKITGAYSGTATLNTITIQYFGAGKYKVLIVQPT